MEDAAMSEQLPLHLPRIPAPDTPNRADRAAQAKRAFRAAQDALAEGDATEAGRLLERWRELAPRPNISNGGQRD
jgi:uncharacterized protein HemY